MSDNLFAFDKTAATIAALHTSHIKRGICHEQVVEALRSVKNAAATDMRNQIVDGLKQIRDRRTASESPEETQRIEAFMDSIIVDIEGMEV